MFRIILVILLFISSPAWAVTQWNKALPATGDNLTSWPATVNAQWSILDALLSNYRKGESLSYKNGTTLTITSGQVVLSNSGASLRIFISDAGNTDITSSNLDSGGSFSNSTTYYVYSGATSSTAATSTYYISLSSTAPTGATYYFQLGSFTTSSSGAIQSTYNNSLFSPALPDSTSYGFGTTYQNTDPAKILIIGNMICNASNSSTFSIGTTSGLGTPVTSCSGQNAGNNFIFPFAAIVPVGWYWQASGSGNINQVQQIN